MYSKIQQEKQQGFSRDAVARHLSLSWRTVDRYWDMTPAEYEEFSKQQYRSVLDKRGSVVMEWLEQFPDLSAAQVHDWLQEHYEELYAERTVRHYVFNLRKQHGLKKTINKEREYFCTEELPPGQQLQADFGQYWAIRKGSSRIKLHLAAFILAHSRYKYIYWQTRPFNAVDFVCALESCFEAFGGIPQELVIDQDTLMTVSENNGDIIHTLEFEHCKNRHGFSIWLCRKADPESKGMVESCVKFVKYNFARNRYFYDLPNWIKECHSWLQRTGNGKIHAETQKKPAEVFAIEKNHLKPVHSFVNHNPLTDMITTPVRKNNTIRYKTGRYSVPIGTYTRCKTVSLREIDEHLEIYDDAGELLDKPALATIPGELVRNNNHGRDTSERINQLMTDAKSALGNTPLAEEFLTVIRKKKGRYIRDQLRVVMKVANSYDAEVIRLTLLACQESKLDSANDLRDFAEHIFRQTTVDEILAIPPVRPITDITNMQSCNFKVVQHQPESYMKLVLKGGKI